MMRLLRGSKRKGNPRSASGGLDRDKPGRSPERETLSLEEALIAETIVVAGGGMVAGDDGRGVEDERPEVVNSAAHSLAVRPAVVAVAAAGRVVGDFRSA